MCCVLGDVYKEMKMLSVIEPTTEQRKFIGGPAMFGPRLGGKTDYKVMASAASFEGKTI